MFSLSFRHKPFSHARYISLYTSFFVACTFSAWSIKFWKRLCLGCGQPCAVTRPCLKVFCQSFARGMFVVTWLCLVHTLCENEFVLPCLLNLCLLVWRCMPNRLQLAQFKSLASIVLCLPVTFFFFSRCIAQSATCILLCLKTLNYLWYASFLC